jgi:hypothetical protein
VSRTIFSSSQGLPMVWRICQCQSFHSRSVAPGKNFSLKRSDFSPAGTVFSAWVFFWGERDVPVSVLEMETCCIAAPIPEIATNGPDLPGGSSSSTFFREPEVRLLP